MSAARVLMWDFDGTLAFRPGNWTGALCEVVKVRERHPEAGVHGASLHGVVRIVEGT